jgi:hypothetical protein
MPYAENAARRLRPLKSGASTLGASSVQRAGERFAPRTGTDMSRRPQRFRSTKYSNLGCREGIWSRNSLWINLVVEALNRFGVAASLSGLLSFIQCGKPATKSATVGVAVRVPWPSPTAWVQGCEEGRALRIRLRNLRMPT